MVAAQRAAVAACWGGAVAGRRRSRVFAVRGFILVLRDVDERHDIGVDYFERRLGPELTAEQSNRLLVRVDILRSTRDETDDEHALKRRHVELGLDWRFDRNLVEVGAAGGRRQREDDGCGP